MRRILITFLLVFIIPITVQVRQGKSSGGCLEPGGGGAGLTYKVKFTRGDTQLYPL